MASRAPKPMTIAEFLAWDDGTDRRYELVDGLPVMMATEAHGEIAAALTIEIGSRLKPPCRVISEAVSEILVVFSDERRVDLQRRTGDGSRVEDLIGRAEICLGCCETPIPLDAVYRDLLAAGEAEGAGSS